MGKYILLQLHNVVSNIFICKVEMWKLSYLSHFQTRVKTSTLVVHGVEAILQCPEDALRGARPQAGEVTVEPLMACGGLGLQYIRCCLSDLSQYLICHRL